jgi:hypothetical protein
MRKIIFSTILFLINTSLFSQQTNSELPLTQQAYLKKSKDQKKVGWILLGGGAALLATDFIIPKGESEGYDVCIYIVCENHKNDDIKAAFGLTGFVSMLASVPFFIASGKNKKRGNSVSGYLKMHKTPLLVKNDKNSYPALHLKITF